MPVAALLRQLPPAVRAVQDDLSEEAKPYAGPGSVDQQSAGAEGSLGVTWLEPPEVVVVYDFEAPTASVTRDVVHYEPWWKAAGRVIGRRTDLEEISRQLAAGRSLCLEGEHGIGKTTVWRAGVEFAREQGFRIVAAEPAEAERSLSYAVLADLLEPIADVVVPCLPEPQRRALERVLLLTSDAEALDARLVGIAVRTSLERLGERVLVAIDDAQWIDAESAGALAFALRRSDSATALLAVRSGHKVPLRVDIEAVPVGPLSVGALHHLLVERLGVALPRTLLLRLHHVSGGNPFYALELARANPEGVGLALPGSLQHLVADRVRGLPAETRTSLAVLALGGEDGGELAPAVEAGIVEESAGKFRFAHPLFAEAAVELLPERERRRIHGAIAERTSDPERRARHLAHATAGPDADVAASVEDAAQMAARRGAFSAAAELWELAARLTPPADEEQTCRQVEAGIAHVLAGNPDAGGTLLEPHVALLAPGPLRQRGLVYLALRLGRNDPPALIAMLEQALEEVEDPRLRYEATLLLARALDRVDRPERADALVEEYLRFAEQQEDPAIREDALLLAAARRLAADRPAWDLLGRAREIAGRDGDRPRRAWGWAPLTAANLREGRIDDACAALDEARSEAMHVGTAAYDYGLLCNRSIAVLAAGDARFSRELADEALAVAEQIDEPSLVSFALMLAMFPEVVLGEVDAAREHGARALELAQCVDAGPPTTNGVFMALGLLELSLGRVDAAVEAYRGLTFGLSRANNVAGGRGAIDVIEAFAGSGDLERASELAARLPDDAHEKPVAEACVAAARGELDSAAELLRSIDPSPAPFRRAREQLLLGTFLRRARQKREARVALEAAREGFLAIDAPLWAERAAEELGRLGGRAPAGSSLTSSEHRVAELVASGLSNKDVAARLVVTVRTVEAHLSQVYEKLGVDSRTILAARWLELEAAKTVDLHNSP